MDFIVMRRFSLFFAGALHTATSVAAEPLTLATLEKFVNTAPAVRLAEADRIAAESRQEVALAAASPRLFVSGTIAQEKEATRPEQYTVQSLRADGSVDEFTQRLTPLATDHARTGVLIGVRIPLFGSREVILRDIDSARSNVGLQRLQEQVSRMEVLKGLRYAYVDAYYRQVQSRLAQTYLSGEPEAERILVRRKTARMVLDADIKGIETTFFSARDIAQETRAAADDALARLQVLAGRHLDDVALETPAFPVECIRRAALESAVDTHPDIALHAAQLEHKRRLLASSGVGLTEGGVSLSHGRAKQSDGGYGHSTAVSVDFSIPLFASRWRRAQRDQAAAEVSKAQLMLDLRRQEYLSSLGKVFGDLGTRTQHLLLMRQKLESAKEANRVASLRSSKLATETFVPLLQARFNTYAAANNYLDAEIALDKAKIDVLGYGARCGGASDRGPDVAAEVTAILTQGLTPALPTSSAGPTARAQTGPMPEAGVGDAPAIGWYAWDSFRRFEASTPEKFWSALPPATRILLSLNGNEVRAVRRGGKPAVALRNLLEGAKVRGIKVLLLLGEPNWALAQERNDLIILVRSLSRFHFAGVHLDLERMQLAEDKRAEWPNGIVATIRKLRAATAVPISLSIHPRDAKLEGLLERLQEAGLDEVTMMAYITDPHKAADMLAPVLQRHPLLRFSVAQSVEPVLPKAESYASFSRDARAKAWRELAKRLRQEPNFAGIIVQSLEDDLDGAGK
jgi:outer membrane protein TolC